MGTPAFALPTLEKLAGSGEHELLAVYTRPDSKSGRGNALRPTPVKERALELSLPVRTPSTLRGDEELAVLEKLAPDAIVVAAYGCIIPPSIVHLPRFGCLNVHGSLLPRWRGAAPVQRAILGGDEVTGVCVMRIREGLDTGEYHTVGTAEIGDKSAVELSAELAEMGARGMLEALPSIERGEYEWTEQDESLVTYADKVRKDETLLRPGITSREFLRRVQASMPSCPSRCVVCGRRIAVLSAHHADLVLPRGQVALEKKHVYLGLKGRAVELDRVKPESKREMTGAQWAAGLRSVEDRSWDALPEYRGRLPVYG